MLPNPIDLINEALKPTLKNVIGYAHIAVGLIIFLGSFGVHNPEVITETINGMEVVLDNPAHQHFNWRAIVGLAAAGAGFGLLFFPTQKMVEPESGRFE